jgi:hypothetical protein
MLSRHIEMLSQSQITDTELEPVVMTLRRLERFWMLPDVRR